MILVDTCGVALRVAPDGLLTGSFEDTFGAEALEELTRLAQDEAHAQARAERVSRQNHLAYLASFLLSEERGMTLPRAVEDMLDTVLASGEFTVADLRGAVEKLKGGQCVAATHSEMMAVSRWLGRKRPAQET